jgi:aminobenzoyl-glutamate utilization protein A
MDFEALVAFRRDLHAHAEPGFQEIRTAAKVAAELRPLPVRLHTGVEAIDLDRIVAGPSDDALDARADHAIATGADPELVQQFRRQGTAIVADLDGNRPGPVWGLRIDMDALPIVESDDPEHFPAAQGFRSTTGAMHACAHDTHTAIGVALAHRLADHDFPGRVRLIFQPAEEGVRGARTMIPAGVVDDVERMLAVHLGLDLPSGTVVGACLDHLSTSKRLARFTGEASHAAAAPEFGRNALLAAATAALNIHALPRFSQADTRVNVGTLHAGDNVNIVPAHAELSCEVRSANAEVFKELARRLDNVLTAAAALHELRVEIIETGNAITVGYDDELVDKVMAAGAKHADADELRRVHKTSGSDDATLFIDRVRSRGGQGTYLAVGGGNTFPHHHPRFDVAESAMARAVDVLEDMFRAG